MVKSGEGCLRVVKNGEKLENVGKSGKRCLKVGKSGKSWKKLGKVGKRGEKLEKVGNSGNRMYIFMRHFHRIRPHIHQSVHITKFANTEEAALQILHALRQMIDIVIDHEPTTHTETFTCKVTYNITNHYIVSPL